MLSNKDTQQKIPEDPSLINKTRVITKPSVVTVSINRNSVNGQRSGCRSCKNNVSK